MKALHLLIIATAVFALASLAPAAALDSDVEKKAQRLLQKWKPRFDAENLRYTAAGPFVIAGDGTQREIDAYRDRTILAAARALHAMYFEKLPTEPVLILLFETRAPYQRLAKKWFDDDDVPHYGFYRRRDNVMLMNVGTGTGTLVHELVHALIAPDFPDVPDWFNEGLGSLYEQCSIGRDAGAPTITGHENWRLAGLKEAIRDGDLRSLRELIEDEKFYAADRVGINYAQARYLLFYLQEKGLLKDYYARFRRNARQDPQGIKTLEALIAPQTLEEFEKDWRKWVMKLRFG